MCSTGRWSANRKTYGLLQENRHFEGSRGRNWSEGSRLDFEGVPQRGVPPLGWVNTSRPRVQNPDSDFVRVVLLKTQSVFMYFPGSPSPFLSSVTPCLVITPRRVPKPFPGHPKGTPRYPTDRFRSPKRPAITPHAIPELVT